MGAVYQAKDVKRQTICAIKEMSLSMVPAEERAQAIQNFKIEAKILWGLNHPNLPAFTGFFTEGQRYFMVMEYIDGYTLEELLERNNAPYSERRVLGWARQLCDVLEYLHSQHPPIIFRDMKPGNVMLTRSGQIKLIDFGIARFFRPTSPQDTQLLGTPGFAPPEQYGKAQTDERSDIYSLAITLFQLLTNTLSETGFGLKDVRLINPNISPACARALEKAASLNPKDRYNSVAEFRRALLGEGTFIFENGDQATSPNELAELCARYPEEASDYLADGEIELWLQEIGRVDLARATRKIRAITEDPQEAVEQFLQLLIEPVSRIRSSTAPQPALAKSSIADSNHSWTPPRRVTPPVLVSPRSLDFHDVYAGISTPQALMISGDKGHPVSGTIHSDEPWIMLDQPQFNAPITRVNVRINSTQLHRATRYTGLILITPDGEGPQKDIAVTVEVQTTSSLSPTPLNRNYQRRGKTNSADLDDDDDDDALTMGNVIAIPKSTGPQIQVVQAPISASAASPALPKKPGAKLDAEATRKYGVPPQPGMSSRWDPLQTSPRQRLWLQRGLTFAAALMVASLLYTLVAQLPPVKQISPLPPSPWFTIVLVSIMPAATLGALLDNRETPWNAQDMINRACTGMVSTLLVLAPVKLLWQLLLHTYYPQLQLVVMLLVVSLAATAGTHTTISAYINYGVSWLMSRVRARWPIVTLSSALGATLGYLLTLDAGVSWFTPLGVLLGIVIIGIQILRVDYLMQQNANNTNV